MRKYRFYYHYRKCDKKMSVHFRKQCIPTDEIECNVPCETKRNKTQPYLVMRGYCEKVEIVNNKVIIS